MKKPRTRGFFLFFLRRVCPSSHFHALYYRKAPRVTDRLLLQSQSPCESSTLCEASHGFPLAMRTLRPSTTTRNQARGNRNEHDETLHENPPGPRPARHPAPPQSRARL